MATEVNLEAKLPSHHVGVVVNNYYIDIDLCVIQNV